MALDKPPLVLTIPSDLGHLASARAFVVAVCETGGLEADAAHAFALAVHEALTNAIRHAHQHRTEVPLEIHCYAWPDRVEVHIFDEGDPFDVAAVPHLDPGELRIGGRGVFLMRALTDELSCEPRGERGNVLRLVKRCGPRSPSCG
jgi:serine/threonine-protein kinase RsbW